MDEWEMPFDSTYFFFPPFTVNFYRIFIEFKLQLNQLFETKCNYAEKMSFPCAN